MEQKPDIIEGVRLLHQHLPDDAEFQGLLFLYYEPKTTEDNIAITYFGNFSASELSVIIATQMNADPVFKKAVLSAVSINKNLANG